MGQTGAGITSEDGIQPGTSFATKWGEFSVLAADRIDAHWRTRSHPEGLTVVLQHAFFDCLETQPAARWSRQ